MGTVIALTLPQQTKSTHPLWKRWLVLRRRDALCPEWRADFWRYVADVSPKPDNAKKMRRLDEAKPYGPGNWEWAKTPTRDEQLAYLREYGRKNYDRLRDGRMLAKYGITLEEYNRRFSEQGGGCAICGRAESEPTRRGGAKHKFLAVDHCHDTGEVRGLLCTDCNVGIGYFNDDPALMMKAFHYLARKIPKVA